MKVICTPTQATSIQLSGKVFLFESRSIYRTVISILFSFLLFTSSHAQTAMWAWVSGDNTSNQGGVYGTQGTAAATNKPGNRDGQSGWNDASGNFWIFGGWDISSNYYNDLWKYSTSTGQWTWMSGNNTTNNFGVYGIKGSSNVNTQPGARRGQLEWTDASGNFWIYGGYGYDVHGNIGYLNDLWMYSPATQRWTWQSGDNTISSVGIYGNKGTAAATNKPGGRSYTSGGVDASGNFWIFGGRGYDATNNTGFLNDLWKYNPATQQWTWMSGDNSRNNTGVYGSKGTAAATNKPGARIYQSGLVDASGNFWVFGGWDYNTTDFLNDLWKYNPTTGQWTWVSGDNTAGNYGVYGTKGTGAVANKPGARYGQSMLMDANNDVWIFGGAAYDVTGSVGRINDLWVYKASSGTWIWESGDNTRNGTGVYGTKGTGAASNKPGARHAASAWLDASSNLWIFGGYDGNANDYNDLWKFTSLTSLPLRKITLRGKHRNGDNVLYWETMGELNTDHFVIERSTNGIDYSSVGKVAAIGNGDNHYTFTDYNAIGSSFYYRIQVQDVDGQVYYSPVVILTGSSEARMTVYPNPTSGGFTLRVSDNLVNTTAKLYDASGRVIKVIRINSIEQYIDLPGFTKSAFTLQLSNGKTFTIIKE